MHIEYELNRFDYDLFLTFQKLQSLKLRRQKVILRWLVCIILLMTLPVFKLDKNLAAIVIVLGLCLFWILFSSFIAEWIFIRRQNRLSKTQTLSKTDIRISLDEHALDVCVNQVKKVYRYVEITHLIRFHGLLILTLSTKEVLLIPRHAFVDPMDRKHFFVLLMQGYNHRS